MSEYIAKNSQRKWIEVSLIAPAVPLIGYLVVDFLYGGDELKIEMLSMLSVVLVILSFLAILLSTMAIYKLESALKLLPFGGVILSLFILGVSFFNATFG